MPQAYDPFDSDAGDHIPSGERDAQRRSVSRSVSRSFDRLLEQLVAGDRVGCRDTVRDALDHGAEASEVLRSMIWPACAMIDTLSRRDQIAPVHEHCATVLLTQLAQRLECGLSKSPARGRTVLVTSGPKPTEELAAEIFAGLAEADGFEVLFLGGGVESDDLFAEVGRRRPCAEPGPRDPDRRRRRRLHPRAGPCRRDRGRFLGRHAVRNAPSAADARPQGRRTRDPARPRGLGRRRLAPVHAAGVDAH